MAKVSSPRLTSPWEHDAPKELASEGSHTVRVFDSNSQRRRLILKSMFHWSVTLFLCGCLTACLGGFQSLILMTLPQKHAFNALITMFSLFLGNNLTSSFREYAQMLRWRLLASAYRPLEQFELLLQCESQMKVLKLLWTARTPGKIWLNKMQLFCAAWLSVNLALQVLVALLGLTYNLDNSLTPERKYGMISICDLSVIRDIWSEPNPSYFAQLGSANSYGIQGQDYDFTSDSNYKPQNSPTVFANDAYSTMEYRFQDQNVDTPDVTLLSHRTINSTATCQSCRVLEGGYANTSVVTYLNEHNQAITLDVVRVGPGAVTYIGVLNSTCGPRCSEVMALQSATTDSDRIPHPSFFRCKNTVSEVLGIKEYIQPGQSASLYQMPDKQAKIMAGAIGWSGFNHTSGDPFQYVRYSLDSWWSPNQIATVDTIAHRIMEFSAEGIAAMDFNGPRTNVSGYYPIPAQVVTVQWQWASAILAVIPFIQLLGLLCIIKWANQAVIKDTSALATARLLRPIVERLGPKGCLLTGKEIASELGGLRVKYGYRGADSRDWKNAIEGEAVRHVDILDEQEGLGLQQRMPEGRYDGFGEEEGPCVMRKRKRRKVE